MGLRIRVNFDAIRLTSILFPRSAVLQNRVYVGEITHKGSPIREETREFERSCTILSGPTLGISRYKATPFWGSEQGRLSPLLFQS